MRRRRCTRYLALLTAITLLLACAAGKESYRQGEELTAKGNWEGAIIFYKDALAKEPTNTKYQDALKAAQKEAAKQHYNSAVHTWNGTLRKDYQLVIRVLPILEKAKTLDPENAKIVDFHNQLDTREQELATRARQHYQLGINALNSRQWMEAVANLRLVTEIYPNYEDTEDKLATAVASGTDLFYKEAIAAVQREDWKAALDGFGRVIEIDPTYKNAQDLVEQIQKNDNPDYFIARASEMESGQEWDKAIDYYEIALSYAPDDGGIQSRVAQAKLQGGRYYFNLANQHSNQDRLYLATQEYKKAMTYSPSLNNSFFFKEALKNHADKIFTRGSQYVEQNKYGNGLLWYWQLNDLNPEYPELFFRIQESEDAIRKRLKKAIAVFDFSSPSYDPDAGTTASSNLITYLFNNSSADIRILERQDLQSILKEMNLEQAGIVGNMATARQAGRMTGIDIFITGNVLLYKTEADQSKGSKVAKIQTGTKVQDNPDYLIWKARHPKPSESQLAQAPPAIIQVPDYRYQSYTVGRNKMRSAFHIYYKILNAKKGEIIATDTIKRHEEVADQWNDGIPEANISFNPLELPTESELLEKVTAEVVRDLALVVLKPFQSLQTAYFQEAENLRRRRDNDLAIERYMDAIFDERIKGIESPISKEATEIINHLISEM